jgi:pimeloyl-ACP methyl ester carboxylesterase
VTIALIEVGTLTFTVRCVGDPAGAPVLLLHGFPQTSRCWDPVVAQIAPMGCATYAPDQRGYSDGARPSDPADYAMVHLVSDAVGLLDALGLASAHVVGHDWGAVVAWNLACRHPDRVRTLTALSVPHPIAFGQALRNDPEQQRLSSYLTLFASPDVAARRLLADSAVALRSQLAPDTRSESTEQDLAFMRRPEVLTAALTWYQAMLDGGPQGLGAVTVPTTFIWGTADPAVGAVAARNCGRWVDSDYRYLEIAGAGHWLPADQTDAVVQALLARFDL